MSSTSGVYSREIKAYVHTHICIRMFTKKKKECLLPGLGAIEKVSRGDYTTPHGKFGR